MYKHFLAFTLSLMFLGLKAQDSLVIMEVNYDLDVYTLTQKEKGRIDSLLSEVPMDWVKKVEVFGHTDSLASIEYNRKLSKNRVLSALKYLVYKGLDPQKAKTDFYGEEKPKYNNSPDTRFRNRRVELWFHIEVAQIPEPDKKLNEIDLKTGDKIQIPNLNFVGNQAIPMWQSFPVLEELLLLMQQNPDLEIELQGHVCCSDNQELSQQRAFMVREFLRVNGVEKKRLSYKGFSNDRPLVKERSDEDKAKNRRVEVLVVKNSDKRLPSSEAGKRANLRVRVNNIKFFPNKGRLYPSGDFMLGLITEMLKDSKGVSYEFIVYDNILDSKVTGQRVSTIRRKLTADGVNKNSCTVKQAPKLSNMPASKANNYIILEIKK